MKKFIIGFDESNELLVEGNNDLEVAQEHFSYDVVKRSSNYWGFEDDFYVNVLFKDEKRLVVVTADKNIYVTELDHAIWEAICEEFVMETE